MEKEIRAVIELLKMREEDAHKLSTRHTDAGSRHNQRGRATAYKDSIETIESALKKTTQITS